MGFAPSFFRHIEHELQARGYVRRPWRLTRTLLWRKENSCAVTISGIEVPHPSIHPLSTSVDAYFESLRKALADLMKRATLTDLILPGGGSLPLPAWFIDWCQHNGIRLHLLDADSQLPEWH